MATTGKIDLQGHFNELKGKKINLAKKIKVEFTKDIGYMKKGQVLEISDTAFQVYKKAGAVKEA